MKKNLLENDFSERRKHIRIYFAPSEVLTGNLLLPGKEKGSPCKVLDLCQNGLHIALEEIMPLEQGEILTLHGLHNQKTTISEETITIIIRWVFNHAEFNKTYIGCEFTQLPEQSQINITNLISNTLQKSSKSI